MITYIVKSEGVDPPGFQKWGGQDTPDPPVGDAPDSMHKLTRKALQNT